MNKGIKTYPIIVIISIDSLSDDLYLLEKSLISIYNQIDINPYQIYIVENNAGTNKKRIKLLVNSLREMYLREKFLKYKELYDNFCFDNLFHTTIINNNRTINKFYSGAYNTGALRAIDFSDRNYFLAFLNVGDEWNENYLHHSFIKAISFNSKIINGQAKTIKPFASISTSKTINKEKFTIDNLLNKTGIESISNLLIEVKSFWAIGGFDESLTQSVYNDFFIRMIEYNSVRPSKTINFISDNVIQFNLNKKLNNKIDINFYRKYSHSFTIKDINIVSKHFTPSIKKSNNIGSNIDKKNNLHPINLIIGVISDNYTNLSKFLQSFEKTIINYKHSLKSYCLVIVENTTDEYNIRPLVNYFKQEKNVNILLVKNSSGEKGISENRTLLQNQMYEIGNKLYSNDYISWIIDDDHLFEFDSKKGTITPNYFKTISELSDLKLDVIFGQSSDAPPLPFLSTIRTQLIDYYYNIKHLQNSLPELEYELNEFQKENTPFDEFYYDLSNSNYLHLEYPYFVENKGESVFNSFNQFLKQSSLLSNGATVFRKIVFNEKDFGRLTEKSIYRGGNTIVFNPELLKIPNYTPESGYNRRSDFNWAIINKEIFGKNMFKVILPLKHDRQLQNTSLIANEQKIEADIKGLIFYRLLEKILTNTNWEHEKKFKKEKKYFKQVKNEVFRKIKANNYRTQTLIYQILGILKDKNNWWYDDKYFRDLNYNIQNNILTLEVLRVELGKHKFQYFLKRLEKSIKIDDDFIKKVIDDVKQVKSIMNE